MEMANPSLVAGVFKNQADANQAIQELKQAGFRDDQIKASAYDLNGVPEVHDAIELQSENNRVIVTVMAEDRNQDAASIFVHNGANNADLPPGIEVDQGVPVRATPETSTDTTEQV